MEEQAVVLHLTKRREDLANRAAALLDQVAPSSASAVTRHQLAQELIADVVAWAGESLRLRRAPRSRLSNP